MRKLVHADPFECVASEWFEFAARPVAKVKMHAHGTLGVLVRDAFDQGADLYFNAEFFAQLAHEAFLESLAWSAFAAGKFP